MNNNLTELVFILDRSGSMSGLEKDTIGGFNSLIKKQQQEEGECLVSTVLFDTDVEVLHDRTKLSEIKPMTEKQYYTRGCTALLDALGGAIHHIKRLHKEMEEDERPGKVMFIITTDGQENSSREYTYAKVKKMVEKQQKKHGWEFLFLGANIDVIGAASSLGIAKDKTVKYHCDSAGTALNYSVLSNAVSKVRSCAKPACCALDADWKEEIEEDYKTREA